MTKQDRLEFDNRLRALPHFQRLAIEHCLNYGLTSKAKELAGMRAADTKTETN
jgi:hypothetical protein